MASFSEDFNGDLSNWNISSAAPIDRAWWIDSGLLKTEDAVSGKFGLILYNNIQDKNGTVTVGYDGIDLYNATDNLVIFRYTNEDDFSFFSIEPGQNDTRGVSFGHNSIDQILPNVEMYNPYNATTENPVNPLGMLSKEVAPNKTIIPQTGIIEVSYNEQYHHITIMNTDHSFVASGDYVYDIPLPPGVSNIHDGYVGFAHTDKWDANINGWDSISVNGGYVVDLPPTIESFSATDYTINSNQDSTIGWVVTSGTDTTQVNLQPVNHDGQLSETYLVSPNTTTTYSLSAWNSVGSDYEEFDITVIDVFPEIIEFENNGPISAGGVADLNWIISGGTSAFIDNGIGWVPYTSAGNISTPPLSYDKLYTITSYDDNGHTDTDTTLVEVLSIPDVNIYTSGAPTCSGSPFELIWNTTNATSAYIDNGIGNVSLNGSMTISANTTTIYTISASNNHGTTEDFVIATMYYRDPIAYAGSDVNVNSVDGNPVSVELDGSGSYDPDGLPLDYQWTLVGYGVVSTDESFDYNYPVGDHTVELAVYDNCGNSATNDVNIKVSSYIPPTSIALVDNNILNAPGFVRLDGSNSYDSDGSISSYRWYTNGILIGSIPILSYNISSYGLHTFTLVVTDNDGLTDSSSIDVLVTNLANPTADAGVDQTQCLLPPSTITLDGSNSKPPIGSELTWFEYDLSYFGLPNISAPISSPNEISATFDVSTPGTYTSQLTVLADTGFSDTDDVTITVYDRPTVSATSINNNVACGEVVTNVSLSAYSDTLDVTYFWHYNTWASNEQFPTIPLGSGDYNINVNVVDNNTGCVSDTETLQITVSGSDLSIIDYTLTPSTGIIYDVSSTDVQISWNVSGAEEVYIDTLGLVNNISGTDTITINEPGGNYSYTISAYGSDGCLDTETVYGYYVFANSPIEICKTRTEYIKTYGIDELKYGKDRSINLVNYLPEYIRNTETEIVLQEFEDYLNNMYIGQSNYTWDENVLDVEICDTSGCKQWTSCNDINMCSGTCNGDCSNLVSSAVTNTYNLDIMTSAGPSTIIPITPADSAGEVFINNICNITDDKISILDKIFRLTELFDPDLMPEHLIQNYAENLGYQAGINRESIGESRYDEKAQDIEQRRYLRFMVRNLPNWYQIKSNRSSIKIMMYSFGLIGDFVYYYTKCYSDDLVHGENGLCYNSDINISDGTSGLDDNDNNICNDNIVNCSDYYLSATPDSTDAKEISLNRWCLEKYLNDINKWEEKINDANNITNDDWMLTTVDNTSLQEDISNIPENKGYFSSPHFKLWIDIDDSSGNYSLSPERQRMIKTATEAIKPINTVFDGVAVYWESLSMMYANPKSRIRKNIRIVSDYTWYSGH